MSRAEKLKARLYNCPKDFTWEELILVLRHCGYKELPTGKTGGSRRRFVDERNHIISSLHKPHPGNIVKQYMLKEVIAILKEKDAFNQTYKP